MAGQRYPNRCYPPAGFGETDSEADSDDFNPFLDIDDYTAAFVPPDHPDPRVRDMVQYWRTRNPNAAYVRQPGVPGTLGDYVDVEALDDPEYLVHGEHGLRDPVPLADVGPVVHEPIRGEAEGSSDEERPDEVAAGTVNMDEIAAMDDQEWDTFVDQLGEVRAGAIREAVQTVAENLATLEVRGRETIAGARRVLEDSSSEEDAPDEADTSIDSQATTVTHSSTTTCGSRTHIFRSPTVTIDDTGDFPEIEPEADSVAIETEAGPDSAAEGTPGVRMELPCHSQDETLPSGHVVRTSTILNHSPVAQNKHTGFYAVSSTSSADAGPAGAVAVASAPSVCPPPPGSAFPPHGSISVSGIGASGAGNAVGPPPSGQAEELPVDADMEEREREVGREREGEMEEGEIEEEVVEPYVPLPAPVPAEEERGRERPLPIVPLPDRGPIDQRRYLRLQNPGMRGSLRTRRRRQTRARQALRARGVDPALIYYRYEWHLPRNRYWRHH